MGLQDLDPKGSPHLEERLISGNVDLDIFSLFPQKYARIIVRIERGAGFSRSTMVGEREKRAALVGEPLGKKVP